MEALINTKLKIEFADEEINKVTNSLEELESEFIEEIKDNQIKELIKLKIESYKSSIILGELYFRVFYLIKELKDFTKSSEQIHEFIKNIEMNPQFEYNLKWYKRNVSGSYFAGQRAESYVDNKREEINTLIDLFFRLFKEEE